VLRKGGTRRLGEKLRICPSSQMTWFPEGKTSASCVGRTLFWSIGSDVYCLSCRISGDESI